MSHIENKSIEMINLRFSGLLAWNVVNSHGSFISMNFGMPRLHVSDVHENNKLIRRTAHIYGDGELWIYMASWIILNKDISVASSSSDKKCIDKALRLMQGQRLMMIRQEIEKTQFFFDLDTVLLTTSIEPGEAQWIFSIDGHVFYEHVV